MGNILECKINEYNYELQQLQRLRQEHLDKAVVIEREMQKLVQEREQMKVQYVKEESSR